MSTERLKVVLKLPQRLTITKPVQQKLSLNLGVRGPAGPEGPEGPKGDPGSVQGSYNFVQASPASTWTINHNLGYRPSCTLYTVGSVEMFGQVVHTTINQCVVSFTTAIAGTAHLV